jgi:transposase
VIRVAPGLTESSRRAVRKPGRSDPIDAIAIARAALREGIDTLPVAFLDERALEIRVLNDYRDQLVNERVRLASRLRWQLVQIAPELEARVRPQGLIGPRIRAKLGRGLVTAPQPTSSGRPRDSQTDQRDLPRSGRAPKRAHGTDRGSLPAAARRTRLRHRDRGDHHRPHRWRQRFPTDACFARHAGTAPIPASSGNTQRHRPHRGGDRQLNRALHIIALSRARTDPTTRLHLDRRHSEEKTKREAIRCLKRHLARRIWRPLYTTLEPAPPPDRPLAGNSEIPNFT